MEYVTTNNSVSIINERGEKQEVCSYEDKGDKIRVNVKINPMNENSDSAKDVFNMTADVLKYIGDKLGKNVSVSGVTMHVDLTEAVDKTIIKPTGR